MKNRKDVTEKALEAYNDVFADIVNVLIYKGEEVVSENELEQGKDRSVYAGEKDLREQERDTTRYWKQNNIRIAMFGIENETDPEDDMPFRIIGYDGAAYRDQIRFEKDADGHRKKVLDRYPVITLVLYMGYEKRWDKAKSIYEVLGDRVDPAFGKYVHNYPINLFEIAFLPDEVVSAFKSDFRFVADYFVQMRKTGTYTGSNEEMVHVREVTQLLTVLTKDIRFAEVVKEAENEGKEIKTMCKVLDEIEERGIRKGIEQGMERGIEQGIEQGMEQELEHIVEVLLRKGKKITDISELCEIPAETIRRINNKLLQKA